MRAKSLKSSQILRALMPYFRRPGYICSLIVPNFKAIRLHIKKLQWFLQVCEKNNLSPPNPLKKKKIKQMFDHPYLTNDCFKLIKFALWRPLGGSRYNAKMCFSDWVMELCMCENCILVLPVNILTVWCAGIFGCKTHYHVSWYVDYKTKLKIIL